ncbi:unnamed protein product [Echinostoma caproni]|uniref:Protein kinase domain-containing protein n=1 Tax=Echinostoma caproni TaxID=27848 RepID=A0A183A8C3_9TREM|nr:unnamed protein product [Echinostoma caproni]
MWAIGVITYILLTGISPFAGDSQIETFQNILDCIVDYTREEIRDATDLAKDFIRRLLVKNPNLTEFQMGEAERRKQTFETQELTSHTHPSDDLQQNCRRGSVIKKANLDGLRHFIAVSASNESSSMTPPLTPVKLSAESDLGRDFAIPITIPRPVPEEAPLSPLLLQTANKPDFKRVEKSRSHNRKHGAHRKSKRTPEDRENVAQGGAVNQNKSVELNDVRVKQGENNLLSKSVHQDYSEKIASTQPDSDVRQDANFVSVAHDTKVTPLPRTPGGWRASLSHGLIGRLGAAFVAAATGHHATSQTPTLQMNGTRRTSETNQTVDRHPDPSEMIKSTLMNESYSEREVHRKSIRNEVFESQDSSDGGTAYSTSSSNSYMQLSHSVVQSKTGESNKAIHRGLQMGNVSRAVQEFESSISTDSDEPQSRDTRNGRSLSVFTPSSESDRKIWDVHKVNKPSNPNHHLGSEPKRHQVGRLQELFESGAITQNRRNFLTRPDPHRSPNPKPVPVLNKRD